MAVKLKLHDCSEVVLDTVEQQERLLNRIRKAMFRYEWLLKCRMDEEMDEERTARWIRQKEIQKMSLKRLDERANRLLFLMSIDTE